MIYREVLNILNSPQFKTIHGRDYYGKIDRMNQFFSNFGHPQNKLNVILVGGTVGKTSTSYYIARLLQQNDWRVGLHVSPHLQSPRERIQINGQFISKSTLAKLLVTNLKLIQALNLSYAETFFGLSILYFWQCKVQLAVIEVGLGGRYDPTNCLNPTISIITNIGDEHRDILGQSNLSKLKIKFAIARSGGTLITGITQPYLKKWLIKQAKSQKTKMIFTQLGYDHQQNDLAIAKEVVKLLINNPMPLNQIDLQIPGRLEWLTDRLLIDCAHNKPSIKALKKYLTTNHVDCELLLAKPGSNQEESAKFVEYVVKQLKDSQRTICATGSIFAIGALRNRWYPID